MSSSKPVVLIKETKNAAILTLNRPKSLNAVTYEVLSILRNALRKFENEKSLVIVKGAGKSFCGGADIKKAIDLICLENSTVTFGDYCVLLTETCFIINTYRIPIVLLINGIAFGAGAGFTALSKISVVTEKAEFAMPEIKFAYHPNVGGTYFLNRSKGKLGYYLGLTGERLKGSDIVTAGYAEYFCHSSNLEKLEDQLLNCSNKNDIGRTIEENCTKVLPSFSLDPIMENINKCFSAPTVEEIISNLKADGSSWANRTKETLEKYSPTSLKVSLKQLQTGKNMDLLECLLMENNITCNIYKHTDILRGANTLFFYREYVPKWEPAKLSDVSRELVEDHFVSSADGNLLKEATSERCHLLNIDIRNKFFGARDRVEIIGAPCMGYVLFTGTLNAAAKMGHGADKKMSETAIRKWVRISSERRCL